jgi:hypothetical protein
VFAPIPLPYVLARADWQMHVKRANAAARREKRLAQQKAQRDSEGGGDEVDRDDDGDDDVDDEDDEYDSSDSDERPRRKKARGKAKSTVESESDDEMVGCQCEPSDRSVVPASVLVSYRRASASGASSSFDCGENCLNRAMLIECSELCQCGPLCKNRRFQRKQYAKVEPFATEHKGTGLRTLQALEAGAFIIEYTGEVISLSQCLKRMQAASVSEQNFYYILLNASTAIDAGVGGNMAKFINHSCEPNCETQKWRVNGQTRIGLFATRRIEPGTELCFDYQWERVGGLKQQCYCGAASCRGYLGAKEKKKDKQQRRVEKAAERAQESLELAAFDVLQRDYCRWLLSLARLPLLMDTAVAGGDAVLQTAYKQLVCEAGDQAYDAAVQAGAAEARADLDAWRRELRAARAAVPCVFLRRNVRTALSTRLATVSRLLTGLTVVRLDDLRRPCEAQRGSTSAVFDALVLRKKSGKQTTRLT